MGATLSSLSLEGRANSHTERYVRFSTPYPLVRNCPWYAFYVPHRTYCTCLPLYVQYYRLHSCSRFCTQKMSRQRTQKMSRQRLSLARDDQFFADTLHHRSSVLRSLITSTDCLSCNIIYLQPVQLRCISLSLQSLLLPVLESASSIADAVFVNQSSIVTNSSRKSSHWIESVSYIRLIL
jgi:hypothetical protein